MAGLDREAPTSSPIRRLSCLNPIGPTLSGRAMSLSDRRTGLQIGRSSPPMEIPPRCDAEAASTTNPAFEGGAP